jgi:PTS system nitrogen regulatory IIA component
MIITMKDVSRLLSVPENVVFGWVRAGRIPCTMAQEQYRFNRSEVLEWATARGMQVSVDLFPTSTEERPPSLARALEVGGVHHGIGGEDREGILRRILCVMGLPEGGDRQLLQDVLLAEDALGSTAIGDGVAVPHVRNPIVLDVDRPSITLCSLAKPLDLDAPDGRPVATIFLMVSPTVRVHLRLLSRLVTALHDARFRELIARKAPREEILAGARVVEGRFSSPGLEGK